MKVDQNTPWMTLTSALLALLFTVVGGVVTLVNADTLSFDQYLERTGQMALAVAALGVGRSVRKGLAGKEKTAASGFLERAPITTITIGLMLLVAAIAGGIATIADPSRLSFADYLDKMNTFAFAVGLQGAGRALRRGIELRSGDVPAGMAAPAEPAAEAEIAEAQSAEPPAFTDDGAGALPADFTAHPDHPANDADLGVAVPEFVDPSDVVGVGDEDEDLGADEEPQAVPAVATHLGEEDFDEDELPTDEDEEAAPPPDDEADLIPTADLYVLDHEEAAMPAVLQPSQDAEPVR